MQKTLKKVLEELNKESPRLDYIRGMLEVLVDEDEKNGGSAGTVSSTPIINRAEINSKSDEEEIPAAAKVGPISKFS